jgi:hypothetical protein
MSCTLKRKLLGEKGQRWKEEKKKGFGVVVRSKLTSRIKRQEGRWRRAQSMCASMCVCVCMLMPSWLMGGVVM